MSPADQQKLRQILASLDEAGLVALANAGLLRRARKFLESGGIRHEETDHAILIHGPDWQVTMPPEGPPHARDNTRATGITAQILAATLHLQQHWLGDLSGSTDTTPSPVTDSPLSPSSQPTPQADTSGEVLAEAVLKLSAEDLEKWAGKTLLKQALALCDPMPEVQADTRTGLVLKLIQHHIEARLFPGTPTKPKDLLDHFRTTAPKAQHERWVLLAILGYQASQGKVVTREQLHASEPPAGTALSRQDVLAKARELFQTMVVAGLAHLSQRTSQRLFTLGVSAMAVGFVRLSRLVKAIAQDVQFVLDRHAAADSRRLLDRLSQADALCRALQRAGDPAPLRLTGRSRTDYGPAPDLTLAGVGAFPWQSASGFEGITLMFWDAAKKQFFTWTASRPVSTPGRFAAHSAYNSEQLWKCGTPDLLCRSVLKLTQPKLNPAGRLSAGKETIAELLDKTNPATIDFGPRAFSSWSALAKYLGTTLPFGLHEPHPLDRLVVLQPTAWGERVFVELTQQLQWTIHDDSGLSLDLVVPWNGVNEPIVEFLEALKPERDQLTHVLARAMLEGESIRLEPLSFFSQGTAKGHFILNPGFDRQLIVSKQASLLGQLRAKYGRDRVPTTIADEDGDALEDVNGLMDIHSPIARKLLDFELLLAQIAESGTRRISLYAERLREQLRDLNSVGLTEYPGDLSSASELLQAAFTAQLYRTAYHAAQLG